MLKTTLDIISRKYPQYTPCIINHIYSPLTEQESFGKTAIYKINDRKVMFRKNLLLKIMLWINEKKIFRTAIDNKWESLLAETAFCLDISGLALSSDVSVSASLRYLARIRKMDQHQIPYIILPQSIGPFKYPFPWAFILTPFIKKIMQKVRRITVRERFSYDLLRKMGLVNLFLSPDIVFSHQSQSPSSSLFVNQTISPDSLLIIPNRHLLDFLSLDQLMNIYSLIVSQSQQQGYKTYLLSHSQEDDALCRSIKDHIPVITYLEKSFSLDELHDLLGSFPIVIASRYHAIVHAYQKKVPCMIIGWADKYGELAKLFHQSDYCIDARTEKQSGDYRKIFELILQNRVEEKETISQILDSLKGKELF